MSVIRVFLCGFLLATMLFVAACGTEEDDELEWLITEEAKPPFTSVTTECLAATAETQALCAPGYQPQ